MSAAVNASRVHASWALQLARVSSGVLELQLAETGFFWRWRDKPEHLVPLLGVQEAGREDIKPHRFFDLETAIGHLMSCTGLAFRGDCGFEQLA